MIGPEDERAQAYAALEDAVRRVVAVNEYEGLVTDWVVLVAVQAFATDGGRDLTTVARLMPDDGRMPYYRMMGLIDFAHAGMRNGITDTDDHTP